MNAGGAPLAVGEIHVCWVTRPRGSGRAALRAVLAQYLGTPPGAVEFCTGAHGKPALAPAAQLRFSWSHCGEAAVVAVSRAVDVGVDIERATRRVTARALAERYFAAVEVTALQALDEVAYRRAFLRSWTAKEAVLKALGEGLAFGLQRVVIDANEAGVMLRALADDDPTMWQVRTLSPPWPEHLATLAWRGGDRRVRVVNVVEPTPGQVMDSAS